MNLTGKIKYIQPTTQITDSFKKAEVVIVTEEQYPQTIKFELHQDKCSLLEGKQIGQRIDVKFNIRGKEYTNPQGYIQVFNTLTAWDITVLNQ